MTESARESAKSEAFTETGERSSDSRRNAEGVVRTSESIRAAAEATRAARAAELESLLGRAVGGRYKVTRLIGVGGMGAVYEAEHVGIGKKVAIKFVDREHVKVSQVASRFAREARAA